MEAFLRQFSEIDMSSILFAIVILSMLVAIIMLVFKPYDYGESVQRFKKIENPANRKEESEDTKWRSVKIRPGLIACDRVADMTGQIFLSRAAPSLPLENCTEKDCRCHYIFLDDRRSGTDRRIEMGKLDEFLPNIGKNRRSISGRRATDLAA
jgi:hypothetical protein